MDWEIRYIYRIYSLFVDGVVVLARYVTYRSGIIICKLIVHFLVIVQSNKRCTVQRVKIMSSMCFQFLL